MQIVGALTSRRRWGQLFVGAAVIGVLALAVSAVGVVPTLPWSDTPTGPADGHPERIDRPYLIRDLPAQPGALAGVVESADGSWYAVTPHGRLWRIAGLDDHVGGAPTLSADGRTLAYLHSSDDGFGEYVVHDLVKGVETAFEDVGSAATDSPAPFWVADQHPAYLSPDGDQVLLAGGRSEGRDPDALVLTVGGGVQELHVAGPAWPTGWLSDGRIAWLAAAPSPELVVTTSSGAELDRARIRLDEPVRLNQWSARLSPDADALVLSGESGAERVVVRVDPEDWREVERTTVGDDVYVDTCLPTWQGEELQVPTSAGLAPLDHTDEPTVAVDERLESLCSSWAQQAIDGEAHAGLGGRLFGTSDASWTWRWREVAAALLLGLAAVGVWLGRQGRLSA